VRAPIASGAEQARQDEARAYYADLAASGDAPVSEKSAPRRSSTGAHVGARTRSQSRTPHDAAIGCGVRGILRSS
jgi:hypothetical protein